MDSFANLKSLYEHIEKNGLDYKYPHQIGDEFKHLRDEFHKGKEKEKAKRAQLEIDAFYFRSEEGSVKPMMTWTGQNGEIVEVPSMKKYDEESFRYLISRLESTKNPLLKARYAQILWNCPKKHAKYAKAAVDSYLKLVEIYEKKDKENPNGNFGIEILEAIKNAFFIGLQSKYRINHIKSQITRLIKKFNPESSSSYAIKHSLVELTLRERRTFRKEDFEGIQKILWQLSASLMKGKNFHQSIQMCELGEKVDQKTEMNTYNWIKRIAELYEALLSQAEGKRNIATLFFCTKALENYKKIKNNKKIEELTKIFDEIKKETKFTEFSKEIDLSDHIKQCREIAEKVTSKEPEHIIKTLIFGKSLLPSFSEMEKCSEELMKTSVVKNLIPEVIIDQSGHPAQHFSDEKEKRYLGILQQFQLYLQVSKSHLIREIIIYAIEKKKLNTTNILKFLEKNSWYGKNLPKKIGNEEITYNWLNLIAPSIHDYFTKIEFFLVSSKMPNFVLSIDSLTLKIEGLLRDLCRFNGIPTIILRKDNKGREIVQERDLNSLLYEEKIKELFNEDDLLFLRFLFVEKAGYNLRHKVAHSLMAYREYNLDIMNLLFLSLLKIGKYDFERESMESSQNTITKKKPNNLKKDSKP